MKTNKLRAMSIFVSSTAVLLASMVGAPVFAATAPKSSVVSNSNTLKISPVRSDVSVPAGTSKKVSVYVSNLTSSTILLKPIENDFVAGDEKGTPSLIIDENSYAPTHSLKRFMVPLQTVTVAPKVTQQVDVTISVPKNAQAGGYYGALRFAPVTGDGNAVNLNASAASLILMTVPGPTVEQLTLTNFDIQQNGGTASNFRTANDLSLLLRFQNKGNLQEAPFGQIYVQKGKKVIYSYNFNQRQPQNEILPDSARRWTIPIKELGKFGKYTIGGTFTYGSKGQSIEITKTIWIIPTTVIMVGIAALVVAIAIVVGVWLFIRSYKRKILRSSRRRY